MSETQRLDCRGLACPQPVIATRDALGDAPAALLVVVDNEGSATNVRRFAEGQGARVSVAREGGDYLVSIEPAEGAATPEPVAIQCDIGDPGSTVVYVASEGMGHGDPELGTVLMEAFLDTLSQFKGTISHAVFVNGGARLAVEGSPVLDQLRQLEELGVTVLVCGTCLNHFGIADRLAVGSLSNMYAIIEVLNQAGRVIRP